MSAKSTRVTAKQVTTAGGPGPFVTQLIDALRNGSMEHRAVAAMQLKSLTEQASVSPPKLNSDVIAEAGGIPVLVETVGSGPPEGRVHALTALANISAGRPEYQQIVFEAGGVPKIASALREGASKAQAAAAATTAALSQLVVTRQPFTQAGAVLSLVALLKAGSEAQIHAAESLAALAKGDTRVQNTIARAGAVSLLLGLLESGRAQEAASHALESLAEGNAEIEADIIANGGAKRLVALLGVVNIDTQAHAAGALAALASGESREHQDAIAKVGGIRPLLSLADSRYRQTQRSSIYALAMLAKDNMDNQNTIVEFGGLVPLLRILPHDSGFSEDVRVQAVFAMAQVARKNHANQSRIGESTAVSSLVGLLKRSGSPAIETECTGALWVLSDNHVTNKMAITEAGAIPAIVDQLSPASLNASALAERAHWNAAHALASLAFDSRSNQAAITPLLVHLLEPGPTQVCRAVEILWRVVSENPNDEVTSGKRTLVLTCALSGRRWLASRPHRRTSRGRGLSSLSCASSCRRSAMCRPMRCGASH